MKQKLEEYYNELKELQIERSQFNESATSTIIDNIRSKIRNNRKDW